MPVRARTTRALVYESGHAVDFRGRKRDQARTGVLASTKVDVRPTFVDGGPVACRGRGGASTKVDEASTFVAEMAEGTCKCAAVAPPGGAGRDGRIGADGGGGTKGAPGGVVWYAKWMAY